MSKVTLVLDLDGLGELRPGDVLVESVLDYAAAYAAMCEAIHAQESRRLVVRNRACAAWLCEAQKKYGSEQVAVSRLDYRSLLEERWHLTIPSWIDDRDLAESRLLEWYGLQPAAGQGFEDMLLDEYWHSAFTYDRLPIQRLADLANEYDAKQWSATLQVPVAQKLLSRRLALWEEKATTTGESYLVRLLSRTPERLRPLLSHLRLLQGYPVEVGLRALGAEYSQLRALGLKLEQLSVETTMLERSRDQIRVYLATKRHSAELGQELQAVIGGMSGLLLEEFDWLESLLKNREVEATRELVERIENRFSALRPTLGGRLTELVLFIEPERPSDPAADWGVDQWLFWATQEYLPYRYWQEDTGASSEEMVGYATKYADWLYASFSSLVGGHPNLVYRAILNAGESLQPDNVLLFVMMDNFGYRFASELSELMAARGYRSPTIVPYVSMLPSATVVSKKAMAVGDPYPFMGTAYKAVVEKAWRQRFDRKALYLGRIGDLEALSTLEHDIYVLNYTPIDEAYHSDPRSTGVSHVEAVRQLLQGLTQAIHNFALRLGIEERLRVAMCSDHGSTLIPDDAPNVIDAKFIAKRVSDAHNRYASLTDHQFANLPESLRSHCYVFKKDVFDLDAHYLAAREYYCLRNDSHASYVHGGLSPEETIVPYFVFSRQTVTVKPPNVVLKQNVFRYSVRSRVQLEVTNTNEYSLERVRVEIVSPTGASNAYAHHGGIASVSVTTIILDDVRFREQDEEIKQIVVELSYDCAGERRSDEHSFVVSMRRIQTSTFDFGIR